MTNLLATIFESLASGFSGAENSVTIIWHFDPIECPKELL